jgi:hypothetical protein
MSIFHIINFKKKNHGHRGPGFFNKKLILDYYFCLKSVFHLFDSGILLIIVLNKKKGGKGGR